MKYNMNITDICIRYIIMMALIIAGGLTQQIWLMVLGVPFFLAGILGWCPLYAVLGINTCHDDPEQKHEHS